MLAPTASTVKPVLRDHCCERPSVLKIHIFLGEGSTFQYSQLNLSPKTTCLERRHMSERVVLKDTFLGGYTFQYNWTCHQRPPVLRDHRSVSEGVVFQDRFYCSGYRTLTDFAEPLPLHHEDVVGTAGIRTQASVSRQVVNTPGNNQIHTLASWAWGQ